MEEIIRFENISLSFGKKEILKNISFEVYEKEIFGILGRSGSGKSTLINILLGVYKPSSGKIYYKKQEITGNTKILKKIIGLTTQENAFYEKLSVYENMVYYANLYNIKKPKIIEILKSVELDKAKNILAERLSGGMKRRLDFAISLIHEPEILILDEPTTGLDPILVKQFWQLINSFSKNGKTMIVVSHIIPEIKQNCQRACILKNGESHIIDVKRVNLMREYEKINL